MPALIESMSNSLDQRGVDAELGGQPFAVAHRDLGVHLLHFLEDVEVGCEARDRTVEEHHVLHEEHELLRRARTVLEQLLRELLQPADELVGRQRGRVDGLVEIEVA